MNYQFRKLTIGMLLLGMALFLTGSTANAKQIILDIPDSDIKIVENDVVSAEEWIRAAWAGKVNKCKDRIIQAEVKRSLEEQKGLPATNAAIIAKAMGRSDYKNRKQRDAENMKAESPIKKAR